MAGRKILPQLDTIPRLGRGINFLLVVNFIVGHWFNIAPFRFRRFTTAYILAHVLSFIMTMLIIFYFICTAINLSKNLTDVHMIVFFGTATLAVSKSCLRTIFVVYKRDQIGKTIESLHHLMVISQDLEWEQRAMLRRLSRYITILLVVFLLLYFIGLVVSVFTLCSNYTFSEHTLRTSTVVGLSNTTLDIMDAWLGKDLFFHTLSPSLKTMYVSGVYMLTFLSMTKVVVTDVLFYACYELLLEQYDLLTRALEPAVCRAARHVSHFQPMVNFHQEINSVLRKLNMVTSPNVVVGVTANTLQLCLVAYVVAMNRLDKNNKFVIMLFCLLSLYETYVYCSIGQKIREKVCGLQCAAYRSSWVHACRGTQQAVQLLSAASATSCTLPGAPFFPLSLEFFASILGAGLTYFIILFQMNS